MIPWALLGVVIMAELDSIARELLALPIDGFTAARNARAAELKAAGNRQLASEVLALRRPSPPLWAVNQLARDPEGLERVRSAAQAAIEAQSGTSAATLRSAATDLQRALDAAADVVREVLRGASNAASDATVLRARDLIRASALEGGEVWGRLASGALALEPDATSTAAGFAGPPASSAPSPAAAAAVRATRAAEELREARLAARDAAQAAAVAGKLAEQLRAEADRLADQARQAAAHAEEAEDAAARAQERAVASERAAEALGRTDTPDADTTGSTDAVTARSADPRGRR